MTAQPTRATELISGKTLKVVGSAAAGWRVALPDLGVIAAVELAF